MFKCRKLAVILSVLMLVLLLASSASAVTLEGKIVQSRFVVPMRGIFEAFGAGVDWDGATRTVTGKRGETTVALRIDSKQATVNGRTVELDVPATIIEGRTYVPARFIAESLGANVEWNEEEQMATIALGDVVVKIQEGIGEKIIDGIITYWGGLYEGEIKNGIPHGIGVWTHQDGWEYEGNWKGGELYGLGTYSRLYATKLDSQLLPLIEEKLLPPGQSIKEYRENMQRLGQFLHAGSFMPREKIHTPADVVYLQISLAEGYSTTVVDPYTWLTTNQSDKYSLVIAWIRVENLANLAKLEAVRIIRPVMPPEQR